MVVDTIVWQRYQTMEKWFFGFDVGNEMVPLMHLGFRGIPNLCLTHDGFAISLVIWP